MEIEIDRLTKVEGHGSLTINVEEGKVEELRLNIFEGSRFFESFMRGRRFEEAAEMASRICGICSYSHYLTALKAVEKALGVEIPEGTVALRKLIALAETAQSHILHLYFLAAADYLGYESILAMSKDHVEEVKRALRLKKLSNDILSMVGGRSLHGVPNALGGFTAVPTKPQLERMLKRVKETDDDVEKMLELFTSLEVPKFERKAEGLALAKEGTFALYEGEEISSTWGASFKVDDYQQHIIESVVPHSTAKHSIHSTTGESFYVGALARVNLQRDHLSPKAKEAIETLGDKFRELNPYINNLAQAIEVVHCFEEISNILERFISGELKMERPIEVKPKEGEGASATEAPRGTLYHHYRINGEGKITYANVITPTAQNLRRMEDDMKALVPQILDLPRDEIVLTLEKLIRAYDPCISCATHFLEVKFI